MRHVPFLVLLAACGGPSQIGPSEPPGSTSPCELSGPTDPSEPETTTPPEDTGPTNPTDTGPMGTLDAAELTDLEGCADVTMYARRPDDTLALVFQTCGAAETAHAAKQETTFTWTLPDPEVVLELREGSYVTHTTCNDSVSYTTVIDETWTATAGEVELVVTPTSASQPWGEYPSDGVLTLTDVVLESSSGTSLLLPTLTISADIGWLPG